MPGGRLKCKSSINSYSATPANCYDEEIQRITGVEVCKATAEIETTSGTVVQVFTIGLVMQVFHLAHTCTSGRLEWCFTRRLLVNREIL